MEAVILTIGDELLIGQVIDSNSAWIATELENINVKVKEIRSIPDEHESIIKNLKQLQKEHDLILITGGLGPTKDDVTKKSIAEFLGKRLIFNEKIHAQLQGMFDRWGRKMKETHLSQCYVPESAEVIENRMGTAQGMWMEEKGKIILSMPGVPYEMKYIMQNGGLEKIVKLNKNQHIYHRTIMTVGMGETWIEEQIQDLIDASPSHIKFAFLPSLGRVRIRLSSNSTSASEEEVNIWVNKVSNRLKGVIYGYDGISLQEALGKMLIKENITLGTAESCTGGYLAHLITSISGSSSYFQGSIISYSNSIKMDRLKVRERTLVEHGAVSEETVVEMVKGAIKELKVDVAIATSGIAGPTGGTPEKPVGTIWVACGDKQSQSTLRLQLNKNRIKNIEYTSIAALNLLRKFLTDR